MKNLIAFLSLISIFSVTNLDKTVTTKPLTNHLEVSADETYLRITIERMRRPERFYNKKFTA